MSKDKSLERRSLARYVIQEEFEIPSLICLIPNTDEIQEIIDKFRGSAEYSLVLALVDLKLKISPSNMEKARTVRSRIKKIYKEV